MAETYPQSTSGVSFEELQGSPRILVNENGLSAVRRFRLPTWDGWVLFVADCLGQFEIQDSGGNTLTFWETGASVVYSPAQIAFPGYPNALAKSCEVVPFQPESPDSRPGDDVVNTVTFGGDQTNTYDTGALVVVQYDSLINASSNDRVGLGTGSLGALPPPNGTYLTYDQDISGEVLTVPGRTFYWNGSDPQEVLSEDLNPGIIIPNSAFSVTWHRVIAPPWTKIFELIGKVNISQFVGYDAGTVLFLGCRAKRKPWFQTSGTLWDLEFIFKQQSKFLADGSTPVGWNYLFKKTQVAGENWVKILSVDGDQPPHGQSDLYELLAYGA